MELTGDDLALLADVLRVQRADYDVAACGNPQTEAEHYAHRILRARKVLEMGVTKHDACYDPSGAKK